MHDVERRCRRDRLRPSRPRFSLDTSTLPGAIADLGPRRTAEGEHQRRSSAVACGGASPAAVAAEPGAAVLALAHSPAAGAVILGGWRQASLHGGVPASFAGQRIGQRRAGASDAARSAVGWASPRASRRLAERATGPPRYHSYAAAATMHAISASGIIQRVDSSGFDAVAWATPPSSRRRVQCGRVERRRVRPRRAARAAGLPHRD